MGCMNSRPNNQQLQNEIAENSPSTNKCPFHHENTYMTSTYEHETIIANGKANIDSSGTQKIHTQALASTIYEDANIVENLKKEQSSSIILEDGSSNDKGIVCDSYGAKSEYGFRRVIKNMKSTNRSANSLLKDEKQLYQEIGELQKIKIHLDEIKQQAKTLCNEVTSSPLTLKSCILSDFSVTYPSVFNEKQISGSNSSTNAHLNCKINEKNNIRIAIETISSIELFEEVTNPCKLFIIGPKGSVSIQLAKQIAILKQLNNIVLEELLEEPDNAHTSYTTDNIDANGIFKRVLENILTKDDYSMKGFVIHCHPKNTKQLIYASHLCCTDALVIIKGSEDTFYDRYFKTLVEGNHGRKLDTDVQQHDSNSSITTQNYTTPNCYDNDHKDAFHRELVRYNKIIKEFQNMHPALCVVIEEPENASDNFDQYLHYVLQMIDVFYDNKIVSSQITC